jgi:gliding motility-associated-like protein
MKFHFYRPQDSHWIFYIFLLLLNIFLFESQLFSQKKNTIKEWATTNPFKTDVFIENSGQFDKWINSSDTIKFVINNSEKKIFLQNGIIFRLDVIERIEDEDEDKDEIEYINAQQEKEFSSKVHSYYIKMVWKECNPGVKIEAWGESQGYYTYGEKGYENIKAKGYKKIIYKDLYPGIDVEYTIPDKGGIKYKLIVNPGADLSKVKMQYSGDVENILIDSTGNICIRTPAGNIIDHTPISFFENSDETITSNFSFKNDIVQFDISGLNNFNHTLIIDPWTTVPTTLETDHAAYDIAIDDYNNVYVSGGTTSSPYFLAKYSATGNIIWTYTIPFDWCPNGFYYSRFCILPNTGTTFMGEAFNGSGPRIMKISSDGILQIVSPNFPPNNEIWLMFYNRCSGQLIAFGGGTADDDNIHIISDTNLTSGTSSNFNTCFDTDNDIASAIMDYNGDFYSLMSSAICTNNNHLMKSLISSNYIPPLAFDINTGYNFFECDNYGIPGFGSGCSLGATVRANTLALNINYLFSYDGKTLIAWDKTNGAMLCSIVVDPSYSGGQYRTHEGITVDDCNNIYVGGTNKVHEYSFNGSSFTPVTLFTDDIPNEVYDISIDKTSDILYVCGLGFITTFPVTTCLMNQLSISTTVDSCINSATVIVNNGTPPYSYLWSNGDTTSTISGVPPGTYIVTVIDNSCILQNGIDTVEFTSPYYMTISNDTSICYGSSVVLSVHGANSYLWSPATGLSSVTDSTVTASPNDTITYIVTGTFQNGCTGTLPITVNVISPSIINMSNDTTICDGDSAMILASGGSAYIWSPAGSLNDATISNPYAHPLATTTYTVTATVAPCSETGSVTISVNTINLNISNDTSICRGQSAFLHATGGTNFFWIPPDGINNQFISSPVVSPDTSTMYFVTVSDAGCMKVDSVSITVFDCDIIIPNVFTPNGDGANDNFNIIYEGPKEFNLVIFNRWGILLFESNDKNIIWNGLTPDGLLASDGVYFYILNVDDTSYHGFVTLIR